MKEKEYNKLHEGRHDSQSVICCPENEGNDHDYDELSQCVMCGNYKAEIVFGVLYEIMIGYDKELQDYEKEALSWIISYSAKLNNLLQEKQTEHKR